MSGLARITTALALALFAGCEKEQNTLPPNLEELRRSEPLTESYGVDYIYSEKGTRMARIRAPRAFEEYVGEKEGTRMVFNRGVNLVFYDSSGRKQSSLRADSANHYRNQGYAEAFGNVVLVNANQEKLETEKLYWYAREEKLRTDAFVKITSPDEVIYGDSLEANLNLSEYVIYKIRGQLQVEDE